MQHVKDKWLRWLVCIYAVLATAILSAALAFKLLNASPETVEKWGITPLIIGFCVAQLLYIALIYPRFSKKYMWGASLVSYVIALLTITILIETSMQDNNTWRALLVLINFSGGLFGIFVPIAVSGVSWLFFAFTAISLVSPSKISMTAYFLVNTLYTTAAITGWLFFKKYYVRLDSAELKALSGQLEQEQFKASVILEAISDGVLLVDTKGVIQLTNASAAQMFGWTKEEALNLDFHSILKPLPPDQANTPATEALSEALKTGETTKRVDKFETLHNREVFVDIVASPIFQTITNKTGESEKRLSGVIAVLRNVDQQKREEQQRSDFISTASHEMRTPVASIQGYLELALNPKISTLDPKTKSYLDKAYEATKHLGQLFQDLLTVSRSEDGRLANHAELLNVVDLLRNITEGQQKRAQDKGLSLTYKNGGEQGELAQKNISPILYVKADPERLREVLSNLVENAIKYTASGSIETGVTLKDDEILVYVRDTGTGIAEEDIPHLFQKFYRVDNSSTREIGGTGLGLYISRQIIELLGGRIWVESKLGSGSTFFVALPRSEQQEPSTAPPAQPTQAI